MWGNKSGASPSVAGGYYQQASAPDGHTREHAARLRRHDTGSARPTVHADMRRPPGSFSLFLFHAICGFLNPSSGK